MSRAGPPGDERRLEVDAAQAGETVAALVRRAIGCSWSRAKDLVRSGRVALDGATVRDPAARVEVGARLAVRPTAPRERPGVLAPERVLHLDRDVMVVRKPAATLTVPWDADDKDTLVDQARAYLKRALGRKRARAAKKREGSGGGRRRRAARDPMLGVVQRLDKDTTGVLVFARNMASKRALQEQLREHTVHRRYLALVHGRFEGARRFDTHLLRDRGDGLRGSFGVFREARGAPPPDARRSITHARAREVLAGGAASLVECRLETGRQHQIRIHLAEAGHPLLGEAVYIRDYPGPRLEAPRAMLHAAELGFAHPRGGAPVHYRDPLPDDFAATLARLRAGTGGPR